LANNIKNFSSNFAYDIDKNPVDIGEIWDVDVINQSIEMILNTYPGERLFNPFFGVGLQSKIFNLENQNEAESILDFVANGIKNWEDRIVVIESQMRMNVNSDEHSVILIIPYFIKKNGIQSVFKKKISNNG